MGNAHTPADDIFYDLVSIQYHALKGAAGLRAVPERTPRATRTSSSSSRRSGRKTTGVPVRAHELLKQLTREAGGGM